MEINLDEKKKKITNWVNNLDDKNVVEILSEIMVREKKAKFDEAFSKGITREELLKRVFAHIDTLPWKK